MMHYFRIKLIPIPMEKENLLPLFSSNMLVIFLLQLHDDWIVIVIFNYTKTTPALNIKSIGNETS